MRFNRTKLRMELVKQDMAQKTLIELTGLSRSTINGVLNGRSCSDKAGKKIAEVLKIDILKFIEI